MSGQEVELRRTSELAGFEGAQLSDVGLILAEDITEERVAEIGELIGRLGRASSWWVADYVRECQRLKGIEEGLHFAADKTGYSERTLSAWVDTAEKIPVDDRSSFLSFSTHIEMRELYRQSPEKYRELRSQLEMYLHREGKNRGHKDVRLVVAGLLADLGVQLTLADFPTTEEELAETRAELEQAERELQELRLETGLDVRCPKCGRIHRAEDVRVGEDGLTGSERHQQGSSA